MIATGNEFITGSGVIGAGETFVFTAFYDPSQNLVPAAWLVLPLTTQPKFYTADFATNGPLPSYTVASGPPQVITATANGALPDWGIGPWGVGSKLLVLHEPLGGNSVNGLWSLTQVGDGSTPFILTRAVVISPWDRIGLPVPYNNNPENLDAPFLGCTFVANQNSSDTFMLETPLHVPYNSWYTAGAHTISPGRVYPVVPGGGTVTLNLPSMNTSNTLNLISSRFAVSVYTAGTLVIDFGQQSFLTTLSNPLGPVPVNTGDYFEFLYFESFGVGYVWQQTR